MLADEWIRSPRVLEGDEALAELAARYAEGHGPATVADLCWWTKLTVGAARRAFAAAESAGRVERYERDGVTWWVPAVDRPGGAPAELQLLPAFDELLLGYRDRSLSIDPARWLEVMSSNGIASPTLAQPGRIVGTWSARDGDVATQPFADPALDLELLRLESERVERFLTGDGSPSVRAPVSDESAQASWMRTGVRT